MMMMWRRMLPVGGSFAVGVGCLLDPVLTAGSLVCTQNGLVLRSTVTIHYSQWKKTTTKQSLPYVTF